LLLGGFSSLAGAGNLAIASGKPLRSCCTGTTARVCSHVARIHALQMRALPRHTRPPPRTLLEHAAGASLQRLILCQQRAVLRLWPRGRGRQGVTVPPVLCFAVTTKSASSFVLAGSTAAWIYWTCKGRPCMLPRLTPYHCTSITVLTSQTAAGIQTAAPSTTCLGAQQQLLGLGAGPRRRAGFVGAAYV
jgi:hypothetical protein